MWRDSVRLGSWQCFPCGPQTTNKVSGDLCKKSEPNTHTWTHTTHTPRCCSCFLPVLAICFMQPAPSWYIWPADLRVCRLEHRRDKRLAVHLTSGDCPQETVPMRLHVRHTAENKQSEVETEPQEVDIDKWLVWTQGEPLTIHVLLKCQQTVNSPNWQLKQGHWTTGRRIWLNTKHSCDKTHLTTSSISVKVLIHPGHVCPEASV